MALINDQNRKDTKRASKLQVKSVTMLMLHLCTNFKAEIKLKNADLQCNKAPRYSNNSIHWDYCVLKIL